MKNKILDLIKEKPKHYSKIIKNNKELSESENLFLAKYRRYWDCGQQPWIIKL